MSEAVLAAVSEARDVSPMDLDEHLFDAVDPDALDRIADGADSAVVSFFFADCTVQVFGSDLVVARYHPDE